MVWLQPYPFSSPPVVSWSLPIPRSLSPQPLTSLSMLCSPHHPLCCPLPSPSCPHPLGLGHHPPSLGAARCRAHLGPIGLVGFRVCDCHPVPRLWTVSSWGTVCPSSTDVSQAPRSGWNQEEHCDVCAVAKPQRSWELGLPILTLSAKPPPREVREGRAETASAPGTQGGPGGRHVAAGRADPAVVLRGFWSLLPPKGSWPWGPSASPVSALSAKGQQHVVRKAHAVCCWGLCSCSRLLSFVSCLQMQQKVKVTTCFDLLIFLFCFGLYTSLSTPPLPSALVPSRHSPPHPLPRHSPTWLRPQPSLVLPDTCGRLGAAAFQGCWGRGGDPDRNSDACWRSSLRSNQRAARGH